MLVLAPVACILSGISVSTILTTYMKVNTVNAQNSMQHLNFSSFLFCFVLFCFFLTLNHFVVLSIWKLSTFILLLLVIKNLDVSRRDRKTAKKTDPTYPIKNEVATAMVGLMSLLLITYTFHCTWVTSEAYSSPSIVLSAKQHDGSRVIFDDFREAYYWLRQNTPEVVYLSVCCQLDNHSSK